MFQISKEKFFHNYESNTPQILTYQFLADTETPVSTLLKISKNKKYSFLLESVEGGDQRGRFSLLGCDPDLIWKVKFTNKQVGKMDSELFKEWFQAFSQTAGLTLHVNNLYGDNNHHIIETCYKGLARSLREAIFVDPREKGKIPSTKGKL